MRRSIAAAALAVLTLGCEDSIPGEEDRGRPPDVRILAPDDGRDFAAGDPVDFIGEGSDPFEGALSGEKLIWTSDLEGPLGVGVIFVRPMNQPGRHTITLTVTDSEDLSASATVRINVSNSAPVASIIAPADGKVVRARTAVAFEARATDREDSSFPASAFSWKSSLGGHFANGPQAQVSTLAAGDHQILLTVTDRHGATDTAVIALHVVDKAPPICVITTPTGGATFASGQAISFQGGCVDPETSAPLPASSLTWKRAALPTPVVLGTGSPFQTSLPGGSQTVLLCAIDAVTRLEGCTSVQLEITPNAAPVCTIASPSPGATVDADELVTFSATADDPEEGRLPSGAITWTSSRSAQPLGTGSTVRVRVPYTGFQTITCTVTDSLGAPGRASVNLSVRSPIARILEPLEGASITSTQNVILRGLGFDAEDGTLSALTWRDNGNVIGTGAQPATATFTPGFHALSLTATDSAAQTGSAEVTFTVLANQAPVITLAAPAAGTYRACSPIPLTCSALDAEDGTLSASRVTWTMGASILGNGATTSWVPTFSGPLTLICTARDSQDVTATASVDVLVTSPSAVITSPARNAVLPAGSPVRFEGQGCDAEENTAIQHRWHLDGSTAVYSTATGFTVSLGAGSHAARLVARDTQGNEASTDVSFRLAAPPTVTISAPGNGAAVSSGATLAASGTAVSSLGADIAGGGQWSDSVHGAVGTGPTASFAPLNGKHVLSFGAADADGLVGIARATYTVGGDPVSRTPTGGSCFGTMSALSAVPHAYAMAANDQDVWIAVAGINFPINHWSASAGNFVCTNKNVGTVFTGSDDIPSGIARAILRAGDGAIWVGTDSGLRRCGIDSSDARRLAGCATIPGFPTSGICDVAHQLARLSDGRIVLGAQGCALLAADNGGASAAYTTSQGLAGARVAGVAPTLDGKAWLATSGGLCLMTPPASGVTGATFACHTRASTNGSLPTDTLWAVTFSTSTGAIWIGTDQGVLHFQPSTGIWLGPLSVASGHLRGDQVRGLLLTSPTIGGAQREVLWVATQSGASRIDTGRLDATLFDFDPGGEPGWNVIDWPVFFHPSSGDKWFASDDGRVRYRAP